MNKLNEEQLLLEDLLDDIGKAEVDLKKLADKLSCYLGKKNRPTPTTGWSNAP